MIINNQLIVVLDLDDTLYNEFDFLKSAFHEISNYLSSIINIKEAFIFEAMLNYYNNNLNTFEEVLKTYKIETVTINQLINIYRNHIPKIQLSKSTESALMFLKQMSYKVGIITDGRSIQQRNKISALGLVDYFDDIIISEEFGSEKPNPNNFKFFMNKYGDEYQYVYIGDNVNKDFIVPNSLGWTSICLLDSGKNIHKQSFNLENYKMPLYVINDLKDIQNILENKLGSS